VAGVLRGAFWGFAGFRMADADFGWLTRLFGAAITGSLPGTAELARVGGCVS